MEQTEDDKHIEDCISQMEQRHAPPPTRILRLAEYEVAQIQFERQREMIRVNRRLPSSASQRMARHVPACGGVYLAMRARDKQRMKRIVIGALLGCLVLGAVLTIWLLK